MTDGELLTRFLDARDETALAALVERHAAMVWGVCRRRLASPQDAEDAFQSVFLVLLRKAHAVSPRERVAPWLYGVARQTADRLRASAAKRRGRERPLLDSPDAPPPDRVQAELLARLDDELERLPEALRATIVLCDLEGLTREEAAARLGRPAGTIASRLARARERLAERLARHAGITTTAAVAFLLARRAAEAAPPELVAATARAMSASGVVSASVSTLVAGALQTMAAAQLKQTLATASVACLSLFGVGAVATTFVAPPVAAQAPAIDARPSDGKVKLAIVRLGVERSVIEEAYGAPLELRTLPSGIESLKFQHGEVRLLVEISPKNRKAIQIYHFKKTPFTGAQVAELLRRNAEGAQWWPVAYEGASLAANAAEAAKAAAEEAKAAAEKAQQAAQGGESRPLILGGGTLRATSGGLSFLRSDGGLARGGKINDEYMLAVLSGSETAGRNPTADADRVEQAKSLAEIE